MALLFLSTPERGAVWKQVFAEAGEEIVIGADAVTDPAAITHILCWSPPGDLTLYPNLQAVICSGAGVDHIRPVPEGVALVRTLAPGIEGMVRDWVVMASLMLHRDMPAYLDQAGQGLWQEHPTRQARSRRVGIMGTGRIGRKVAETLRALDFPVLGYSRSGRPVEGLEVCGQDMLDTFLAQTDLLICLLPLTDETRGLMDAAFLAKLPKGALLVHAGRGAQLHLDALGAALDSGQIGAAMLDVTDPEPLPQDHWAWTHPKVVVTPHIGSVTDYEEGARHGLNVIRAGRAGEELPGLVDPARGY
ncbi:glyoxylate/hydroxypyruvate reductase A [Pseudooceanicola sp. CBS1P-1]|uniref:Glyoxylate/hydroxypyruvate reductase A n=1 Tax=Pseudooceanicola albus TaxID=2692189 RepID=A0A6L7G519_9RHOB|nr:MULTISPECIES: glyoxylate/hydroxypyruvate reductase A [Pseudooceanicola]MBT9385110.1 glyoxylate/hydroxypyruvate reductase A [Pseudooceanicola endophyticus]MXN18598.1 glyoxylate/hydroxypyruvate reductase A [Pseudooceanicola albus]